MPITSRSTASADASNGAAPAARIGWLFAYDWDRLALDRLAAQRVAHIDRAGFDLFSFPDNAQLIGFDLERFAQRQAARGRRLGWRGVVSHHEQFGALAAALVAERLGLPGATPESVLAAQHKLVARQVLAQVAPEASLPFASLPMDYGDPVPDGLTYPLFVKPVKAAFSVLARSVASRDELERHLHFSARETWVLRRLVEPFDRVCRHRLPAAGSAHRMMVEQPVPIDVPQFNLDGWVQDGHVHALGVVDAITAPGTQAFVRWEVPSRLPAPIQHRALDVARRFLHAIGYRHGFFNLEFFFDAASDRLTVIECNPRLASQFGDLYRRVQGVDAHRMAMALALGEDPRQVPRGAPAAGAAASLVYRAFDAHQVPPMPRAAQRQQLAQRFADALLLCQPKRGHALARDFKWTGSHRYGVVHLGGSDRTALRERAIEASALLGWPAPYFDDQPATEAAAVVTRRARQQGVARPALETS